ncbi:uncharacterized protein LOC116160697 [Photinus pyralis]|nr:uncharacterized protein LOC116160697 [Photinus pyralis]
MHAFLHCLDNKRPTQDNLAIATSTPNETSDASDQDSPSGNAQDGEAKIMASGCQSHPQSIAAFELPKSKKRKSNIEQVSSAIHDLKKIAKDVNKEPLVENEFLVFGKCVAAQLMKLSTASALLAQEKIQSVLTHFRIQELEKMSGTPLRPVQSLHSSLSTTPIASPSPSYSDTHEFQPSTSFSSHQFGEPGKDHNTMIFEPGINSYSDIVAQAISAIQYNP